MPRIACDGCDIIQPDQGLVGWIRVAPHGVDTSTYPHGFWEQERYFHSLECLATKLATTVMRDQGWQVRG